ncbi:MAG: hypothetical protein U0457_06020 [Candidatus Sericytochromatia bacterium]
MKNLKLTSLLLVLPFVFSCAAAKYPQAINSEAQSVRPYPSATPSAPSYSATELSSLRAGVLPESVFTDQERKLAGYLVRKTIPVFPMKIGVVLYKNAGVLPESDRKRNIEDFVKNLRSQPDIGQVVEISSNLLPYGSSINDIRALGARFQVSSVFVVNESYPSPTENKEAIVTPIDSITGARTWESYSKVDVYGIDILNGVFILSTSSGIKENKKYNTTNSTIKNPDILLVRSTADKAWAELKTKVNSEIVNYKNRVLSDKVVPIIAETPLPTP